MYERVVEILKEYVDVPESEITMESSLVEDLGLSSLGVINIACAFEEEFDIEIPERVIPNMRTVGDIVEYLGKACNE